MRLSLIAAVAENGIIGRQGRLPWHLTGDLRRFKQLTTGHTIIMGRRTWESIGRALPGRRTVVVTRQAGYRTGAGDVQIATSLDVAVQFATETRDEEAFIIGGAELYREALSRVQRIYMTRVHAAVDGDTYFPEIQWADWRLIESEEHDASKNNDYAYTFEIYERS